MLALVRIAWDARGERFLTVPAVPPLYRRREFGFILEGRTVVVDDVRVRGVGRSPPAPRPMIEKAGVGQEEPRPADHEPCYWEGLGRVETPVHMLAQLKAGHQIEGEWCSCYWRCASCSCRRLAEGAACSGP